MVLVENWHLKKIDTTEHIIKYFLFRGYTTFRLLYILLSKCSSMNAIASPGRILRLFLELPEYILEVIPARVRFYGLCPSWITLEKDNILPSFLKRIFSLSSLTLSDSFSLVAPRQCFLTDASLSIATNSTSDMDSSSFASKQHRSLIQHSKVTQATAIEFYLSILRHASTTVNGVARCVFTFAYESSKQSGISQQSRGGTPGPTVEHLLMCNRSFFVAVDGIASSSTKTTSSLTSPTNKRSHTTHTRKNMPLPSSPLTKKRCIFSHETTSSSKLSQNHSYSCTALPSLLDTDLSDALLMGESSTTGELDLTVSPAHFIVTILQQSNVRIAKLCGDENIFAVASRNISQGSYFINLTEDQQLAYTNEKVGAVQDNDVDALRLMLHSGEVMQTSNRFGESLLHTACRRGFADIVHFFLYEARVCPRIRDDMGRTPMHDACWSSCSPNHELMRMLIDTAPEMLLARDIRGHTPFDYARREHWPNWVMFLNENRQYIVKSFLSTCLDGESVSTQSISMSGDSSY